MLVKRNKGRGGWWGGGGGGWVRVLIDPCKAHRMAVTISESKFLAGGRENKAVFEKQFFGERFLLEQQRAISHASLNLFQVEIRFLAVGLLSYWRMTTAMRRNIVM